MWDLALKEEQSPNFCHSFPRVGGDPQQSSVPSTHQRVTSRPEFWFRTYNNLLLLSYSGPKGCTQPYIHTWRRGSHHGTISVPLTSWVTNPTSVGEVLSLPCVKQELPICCCWFYLHPTKIWAIIIKLHWHGPANIRRRERDNPSL